MADNQQFCLRWNNHQSTLVQVIDSLLSSGILVDCTLAAEGQYLNAHKVVLCACSPYLEAILSQHYEKHPIVILKDVKFQELKSMMDYMYKGEVNISQDQLGQFLKAAESLQIKGLTDGGGENDSRDVGSTSQKRHEPTPVRKAAVPHQSRSPLVLPSHSTGLTIEPSKRSLPTHLSEPQPDSPIRSREGSSSPTSRKRRRQRRPSQGDEDGHQDNSCDLPMPAQTMSITTVPTSIPPLPSGSSSTITKAPPPDDDSENPENDRLSGLPAEGYIKEKIEPQPEMLLEPKTEYMEETNNDDSVEDLTLDDDDDYENMMDSGPGPSHGSNNPNENYAAWQQMTGDRQDDAYLNPADSGHRDSQGSAPRHSLRLSFTPEKLAGLNQILSKRRVFSPEDIRNIATYFKLQESKCRIWFKENGARLRRQACSVRILPDTKKGSSDRRKSYVLKVRKRSSAANPNSPGKGGKLHRHGDVALSSTEADASTMVSNVEENDSNFDAAENDVNAATPASEFDEHDVGMRLLFSGRDVSSDTDTENHSVRSEATAAKREPDANFSGSDESKSAVSADGDSSLLSSGSGVQRTRDRFFNELPFDKKILLLKRTQHLSTASSADAQKLAVELEVPFRSVYSWLKSKTIRQFRTWSKRLSREKTAVLDDEFAASPDALSEERALLLSYELDLSVCAIRRYFERKRTEMKTESDAQDSPTKTTPNVSESSAGEHESTELTEDCSSSRNGNMLKPLIVVPQYVPSKSEECGVPSSGIWLRPRPSSNDPPSQSKTSPAQPSKGDGKKSRRKVRFVLTPHQRKLLIQHFQKSSFIAPADASVLSNKLGLPVKAVQLWFHRKRMEKNQTEPSETGESSVANETVDQSAKDMPNV